MEKSGDKNRTPKKIWLVVVAAVIILLILIVSVLGLSSKNTTAHAKSGQTVYKLKISSVKVDDMSNWEIKGTTSAPDGAKLFATYGDETDSDSFGVNAAVSKSTTSWSKVVNGKFTMLVDPLTLHYESNYKSGEKIKAYLFAITKLSGDVSKYSVEPKISSSLKTAISKSIKATSLEMSSSQADYYNKLGNSDSSSSSSSTAESSSVAESSSSSDDPTSYKTGITYDQIARTPDDYKGKKMQFTGKVVQVVEDKDETDIRLAVDGNYDNIIMVGFDPDILNGSRVLEDDLVTISGKSVGTISYKSTNDGKITVPAIMAKIVDDQGKASDDYGN